MSYMPFDRNASGIVYFGPSATDQVLESNSNFTFDGTTVVTPNIRLSNGGTIGNASYSDILSLGSNGIATFSSGLVINGDLTVQGNQVILNTETLNVEDNIVVLNSNVSAAPTLDAGLEVERGTSSNVKLLWDEGNDYWSFTNNGSNYYRLSSNSSLMAGSGLVDGGVQEESRILNIGAGTGIVVSDNAVHVGPELISGRAELTSVDNTSDYFLVWDATDSTLKKVNRANFVAGSMNNFVLSGDSGSSQTVGDGGVVTISGGMGLNTTAQSSNTLVVDLKLSELSSVSMASGDSFLLLDSDGTTHQRSTISDLGSYLAGTNLSAGPDGKLSVAGSSIKSAVFDSANFVDGTTIDFTVTSGQSVTAEIKSNSISESYLTSSVAGNGLSGGNGSALAVNVDNSTIEINSDALRVKDSGITSAKIANEAVGTTQLANSSVTADKLAADAVTTSKILDSNVTTAKLANNSVTESKLSRTVATVSSAITLSSDINLVTAGSGGVTVTLPVPATGKMVIVKKTDSAAGIVTVSRNNTDTIDGTTAKALYYQYESLTFVSDGSNWFIV